MKVEEARSLRKQALERIEKERVQGIFRLIEEGTYRGLDYVWLVRDRGTKANESDLNYLRFLGYVVQHADKMVTLDNEGFYTTSILISWKE